MLRRHKHDASARRATEVAGTSVLTFEGARVCCAAGTTVAAALYSAGVRSFRESAAGSRGLYCGMGVCQECLVTIDGVPGRRACMTTAAGGMRIERHPARVTTVKKGVIPRVTARPAIAGAPSDGSTAEIRRPQVLVVGGGPGGLAAAVAAAEAGAQVTLVDERSQPGGQYFKQPQAASAPHPSLQGDRQYADGRRLIARALAAGVEILGQTIVWGGFPGPELRAVRDHVPLVFRPATLIVAAGAYERAHPVPGWILPGVMTTGAAQSLLRMSAVVPPGRILVAGNGPLNLQVALELSRAGARVIGVAELAHPPGLRKAAAAGAMLAAAPRLTLSGMRILAALKARRLPVWYGRALARVSADGSLLDAELVAVDGRRRAPSTVKVDTICLGYGFQPNNELLRMLGCAHDFDPVRGQFVTRRDQDCGTSVAGIFAVGDCTGLGGAPAAQSEGELAGLAAARRCGIPADGAGARAARRGLGRHRRFQAALWSLYAPVGPTRSLTTPETVVCRCENVTSMALDEAIAGGCRTMGAVKRKTRLGMGHCQGRYCVPVALARLAGCQRSEPAEFDLPAPRPPLRPLTIAELADLADLAEPAEGGVVTGERNHAGRE